MAEKYGTDCEEWFSPKYRGFRQQCCSCGLVHVIDFRIKDGEIEIRFKRHERATAAVRRTKKKSVVIVDD